MKDSKSQIPNPYALLPFVPYLKSCPKPKWYNHVSVQLGPHIKNWHDERNHQQLQYKETKQRSYSRSLPYNPFIPQYLKWQQDKHNISKDAPRPILQHLCCLYFIMTSQMNKVAGDQVNQIGKLFCCVENLPHLLTVTFLSFLPEVLQTAHFWAGLNFMQLLQVLGCPSLTLHTARIGFLWNAFVLSIPFVVYFKLRRCLQ